ncbi:PEPxxWA-CTERM sorting domain-containing protein [uncultured Sphingomonas sp.]|uniref:PEPxxWA-CTERM sorting domain-containing protein n=1 Tax=uncultured Sphingomonas sp. TaxID=158754 RepID=UPI0035CC3515
MIRTVWIGALIALATTTSAHAATTLSWSFAGTNTGSGQLTYDDPTDVVTAFSGAYAGGSVALVSFTSDPNNPGAQIEPNGGGLYTYRAVPNTGGANYTFDGLFHQTYANRGYLVSTGTGANERVYVLNVDHNSDGADQFNFFSINPDGSYRQDFGTFATSTVTATGGVPEAATWTMMIAGFGVIGFSMRRRTTRTVAAA